MSNWQDIYHDKEIIDNHIKFTLAKFINTKEKNVGYLEGYIYEGDKIHLFLSLKLI